MQFADAVLKGSNELSALQGVALSPLNTNISLEKKLGCIFTKAVVLAWHQFSIISVGDNFQRNWQIYLNSQQYFSLPREL